jgi:hypothetical protein
MGGTWPKSLVTGGLSVLFVIRKRIRIDMATLNDFENEVSETLQESGLMAPTPESKDFEAAFDGGPSETSESEVESEPSDDDGEQDFRARIWNAETECRKKELMVELAKEDLKEAKAAYDDAVDRLRKLARDAQQPTLFNLADGKPADESWKERDFHEWLDDVVIDGLGDTKREALKDANIDTFGDFEQLRVEAGKTVQHLSKLLPKGFGKPVTDEIEKAFLAARDE